MRIHSAESGSGGIGSKAGRLSVVVGEPGGHILNWHSRARGARATLKYSNQKKGHAAFATWPLILCRRRPNLPHTFACSTIGPAGLNFRVRDGNGWNPRGVITDKLVRAHSRAKLLAVSSWLLNQTTRDAQQAKS